MLPELLPYAPMLQIFSELNKNEWANICVRKLNPKESLIEEGHVLPVNLYFILEGVCIAVKKHYKDDSFFSPYKICAGEITGLREILNPAPSIHTVSIIAKTPVTALEIQGDVFLSWRIHYGITYNQIIRAVLCQHFTSRKLMINCTTKDSLTAGAYYLHTLYKLYRDSCYPKSYHGDVKIWDTRSEIAAALGRNIRSVDRVIQVFMKKQYLSLFKGKIHMNEQQYQRLKNDFYFC